MLDITEYELFQPVPESLRIAVVADLHDEPYREIVDAIGKRSVDLITVPGDLYDSGIGERKRALAFLREAASLATTVYTFGNHECRAETDLTEIEATGCKLLNNQEMQFRKILIGGLSSKADLNWLHDFSGKPEWKLLLCHHPEYYKKYLKRCNIDLIVSGHAHGGQIRFGNRGIYAVGQGPLPKYTSGVHDNRLVVSRGIGNHTFIPRIRNRSELVFITVSPSV